MSANPAHPFHVACGNNKMLRDDPKEKGHEQRDGGQLSSNRVLVIESLQFHPDLVYILDASHRISTRKREASI